ncbi:MAG: anti-sigma factor family protein [Bryobacteraceae bacterium]
MTHIPDYELLMESDGELDAVRGGDVRRHVSNCAACRSRQLELTHALGAAVEAHLDRELPPIDGARALLQARMQPSRGQRYLAVAALAAAALSMVFQFLPERAEERAPRAALTPGAIRAVTHVGVCGGEVERPAITNAVALEVFRKYGIHDPRPRAYEVDLLIPPDLGGSEDPANLWPQAYSAGTWNARVKDALEDRLRSMVCDGSLELTTAQREIAADWIGAYKKHFRTNQPLPDHVAFVKDQPWE